MFTQFTGREAPPHYKHKMMSDNNLRRRPAEAPRTMNLVGGASKGFVRRHPPIATWSRIANNNHVEPFAANCTRLAKATPATSSIHTLKSVQF
jgi:hypothetical protein